MSNDVGVLDVPPFLELAAHPIRWRLLRELTASDRQVRELTELAGEAQNVVSYHLGRLTAAGLVSSRRSSADGRVAYYRVDLDRCAELLAAAGAALHPSLTTVVGSDPAPSAASARHRPSVLFLCSGNSSRSQIAEALLRHRLAGRVDVASAGSHPKPVHPMAVEVLAERDIDISSARSKSLERFTRRRFDHVVTVCDRVREVCPEFPGRPRTAHWSVEDPSARAAPPAAMRAAFRATADDLERRIEYLLPQLTSPSTRRAPAHRTSPKQEHTP
jgi:protein-tyrosine-phosphatase